MFRFRRSSSNTLKKVELKDSRLTYAKSVVDKSYFRPTIDDLHNQNFGSGTPVYDFKNGVITSERFGSLRNLDDITEIEAFERSLKNDVENQKADALEKIEAEIEAEIEAQKASESGESETIPVE